MATVLRENYGQPAAPRDLSIVDDINRRVTLVVALVAAVVIVVNYLFSLESSRRQIDDEADEVIAAIGEAFRVPFWDHNLSNAMEIATVFAKSEWVTYIRVRDAKGHPIAGIGMREEATVFRDDEIRYGDKLIGSVTVGLTETPLEREARYLLLSSLFMLLAVIAALYIFNQYFLRRSLQRSVKVLLERIHRIADNRYDAGAVPAKHREVREILEQFDSMAQKVERRERSLIDTNRQLQEVEAALKAHRDQLEQTVAERTRELMQEIEIREAAEEEAQAAKEAADKANRAKSEFLAQMSHELRTPLNGILGYAQILRKHGGLSEEQMEGLETIRSCGEHLLSLINEVLDLAKIEAGKIEFDARAFSLTQLTHGIEAIFRQRAAEKDLRFSLVADAMPRAVHGDERKLRQVLINLLGNAVNFTESGEIVLRVTAAGKTVRFEVRDTGIGIPEERLGDLFQPFTQLRDLSQPKEGTGLGLAISQRLVAIMGGALKVESTPGTGTRFWFELILPAAEGAVPTAAKEQRAIAGYRGPRRKVLIVDDKPVNRQVLLGLLEPLGFECREAKDGEDCMRQAAATAPDIILMDIVMPRLDGLEAARRLRRAPETRDIPIIAMSASVFEKDKQLCFESGCTAFFAKPVIADTLFEVLARCLSLEWIRDEPRIARERAEPHTDVVIEQLPEATARALYEAAHKGHGKGVVEQTLALEALGDPYAGFASQLRELAKQFRFDEIVARIEPFLSTARPE